MSLDSRLRLARRKGTGARIHPHEIQDVCEALRLLRACERAERGEGVTSPEDVEITIGRDTATYTEGNGVMRLVAGPATVERVFVNGEAAPCNLAEALEAGWTPIGVTLDAASGTGTITIQAKLGGRLSLPAGLLDVLEARSLMFPPQVGDDF